MGRGLLSQQTRNLRGKGIWIGPVIAKRHRQTNDIAERLPKLSFQRADGDLTPVRGRIKPIPGQATRQAAATVLDVDWCLSLRY